MPKHRATSAQRPTAFRRSAAAGRRRASRAKITDPNVRKLMLFVANTLHQGAAQHLVHAVSLLRLCDSQLPPARSGPRMALQKAATSAEVALKSVRMTIDVLRSPRGVPVDVPIFLPLFLRNTVVELRAFTRARFRVVIDDVECLSRSTRLPWGLGVVAREALTNAAKHAQARNIGLMLRVHGDTVALTVHDDDRGFQQEPSLRRGGAGLSLMRSQVESLGGTLRILRPAAGGTRVTVVVPIHESGAGEARRTAHRGHVSDAATNARREEWSTDRRSV